MRLHAQAEGKFDDEIVPVEVDSTTLENGTHSKSVFKKDEGPRADTSLEALAKLKPVFQADGTVTAGNSSQTSDGAAAAIVMSREESGGTRAEADGPIRQFRRRWRAAGNHGHRPGGGDSQSARAGRLKLDDIGSWN